MTFPFDVVLIAAWTASIAAAVEGPAGSGVDVVDLGDDVEVGRAADEADTSSAVSVGALSAGATAASSGELEPEHPTSTASAAAIVVKRTAHRIVIDVLP